MPDRLLPRLRSWSARFTEWLEQDSSTHSAREAGIDLLIDNDVVPALLCISALKAENAALRSGSASQYHRLATQETRKRMAVEAENERLAGLVGFHDPTGADHMEDAARLAVENDDLRADNQRLRNAIKAHLDWTIREQGAEPSDTELALWALIEEAPPMTAAELLAAAYLDQENDQ